ncbi:MAG TPA: hypothetical protein VH208_06710, partial [Myxococcaceae bacterium]|nr:hypothetical protein [Myxococcaceae bacterium]
VLAGAPNDPWDFRPQPSPARARLAPTSFQRSEALDDLEAALKRWPRERTEFAIDREQRARWLQRPTEPVAFATPEPPTPKPGPKAQPSRFGKVIEVAPFDVPEERKTWIEQEIGRLQDDQVSLDQLKRDDPLRYAREKVRRSQISAGNRAWEAAVAKKRAEQLAAIEAEAVRMQEALNVARRREAELNAKRMGGSLDAEGNFVDPDLEEKK